MSFPSILFLSAFLPLTAALYYLARGLRARNLLLAAAGLVFYAFGRLADLPILLSSVLVHYLAGRLLLRLTRGRRAVVVVTAALDLGLLIFYKYLSFFLPFAGLTARTLPLGISFFTFQGISYVVDAYRDRDAASRRFFPVLQYLAFFPNLVSGPLQKFRDFRSRLTARRTSPQDITVSLRRFTVGLAKKLIVAGTLGAAADAVFALAPGEVDIRSAWLGALCYALQIYFDFSGYSDMAVGVAGLFGFPLPENFRYPYRAASITDFWRRWHMSLSGWFRDYLYIPLGGSRRGRGRAMLNKGVVFLATGLWHGASWTFVLWGLWHGLFAILETAAPSLRKRAEGRWWGHGYALLAVVLGFVLFRAESVGQAVRIVSQMFAGFHLTQATTFLLQAVLSRKVLAVFILACVLSLGAAPWLARRLGNWKKLENAQMAGTLLLLLLSLLALAGGSFQPFIYQQF
ncbi:MAG: MBOAT family protein [Oscillospiraceae bacterium]|nr:MBOAT family protein [Oscillospiraceae bacterium]